MQIWQKLFFPADISWLLFPQQQAWLAVPSCWRRAPYLQSHESKRVAIGKGGRKLFGLASRKDQKLGALGGGWSRLSLVVPWNNPRGNVTGSFSELQVGAMYQSFFYKKSSLNLLQYCFCFTFWFFSRKACVILAPWTRMELAPSTLEGDDLTIGPPRKSWVS